MWGAHGEGGAHRCGRRPARSPRRTLPGLGERQSQVTDHLLTPSLALPDGNDRALHMPGRGAAVTVGRGHQALGCAITQELGHEATRPLAWDPGGRSFRSRCPIFIPQSESERQNGLSYRKLFVPDAGADSPQELWFLVLDPGFSLLL